MESSEKWGTVRIDRIDFTGAVEWHSEYSYDVHYLDLKTGRVILLSDAIEIPEMDEDRKIVEEDSEGRFLEIEALPSREEYEWMEDFTRTVREIHLREKLDVALNGKGAFRRFKDVLSPVPEERERWFAIRDRKVLEFAEDQLRASGVKFEWKEGEQP